MRSMAIGPVPALVAIVLSACGAGGVGESSTKDPGAARSAVRPILDGDGIGSLKFGRSPAEVAKSLGHMFGAPVGAKQVPHGYLRAFCGFHWETWDGVGASSKGQLFVAQLSVWFRNSRFVGYDYGVDNFSTANSNLNRHATPGMMLTTAKGLAVGDPVALGDQLYGRAFVVSTRMQGTPPDPRLPRIAVWALATATGPIDGSIGNTVLIAGAYDTATRTVNVERAIHSIDAGALPNTPCHT
jgi:hypothetical protein